MWNKQTWKAQALTTTLLLTGAALLGGSGQASVRAASVTSNDLRGAALVVRAPTREREDLPEGRGMTRMAAAYTVSLVPQATFERVHTGLLDRLTALGFRPAWSRPENGAAAQVARMDAFSSGEDDVTVLCLHWGSGDTYSQVVRVVPRKLGPNDATPF